MGIGEQGVDVGPGRARLACDEQAWALWVEVERAVKELMTETAPPDATQH
jgi:hypothetical protein